MGEAREATWETETAERCARSWPAVVAEMEEGGRDKASLQTQQSPSTTPGGAEDKPGGKDRRDAGDKDKEQELVRHGPGSRRRRPWAESPRLLRPRARLPTTLQSPGEGGWGDPPGSWHPASLPLILHSAPSPPPSLPALTTAL